MIGWFDINKERREIDKERCKIKAQREIRERL